MNEQVYDVRDVKCVGGPYNKKIVQFYNFHNAKKGDRIPDASLMGGQNEKLGAYYVQDKDTIVWVDAPKIVVVSR